MYPVHPHRHISTPLPLQLGLGMEKLGMEKLGVEKENYVGTLTHLRLMCQFWEDSM